MSNKQPKFVATYLGYCGVGTTVQQAYDELQSSYSCDFTAAIFYEINKQVEVELTVVPLINVKG